MCVYAHVCDVRALRSDCEKHQRSQGSCGPDALIALVKPCVPEVSGILVGTASSQRLCFVLIADIDECATGRHTCGPEQTCYNTRGSYTCQCPVGYQRNGDHCTG